MSKVLNEFSSFIIDKAADIGQAVYYTADSASVLAVVILIHVEDTGITGKDLV